MRAFITAMALACAGCAAPPQSPQDGQERYIQVVDPANGRVFEQIDAVNGEACRIALGEAISQYGLDSASLLRCSATSAVSQLPYRMRVKEKSTQHLIDWNFLTLAGCQDTAASKLMEGYTLVAPCGTK